MIPGMSEDPSPAWRGAGDESNSAWREAGEDPIPAWRGAGEDPNPAWRILSRSCLANSLCLSLTDPCAGLGFCRGVGFGLGLGTGLGLDLDGEAFFLSLPRVMNSTRGES